MPIYEFRCLKCNDCFEFLLKSQEGQIFEEPFDPESSEENIQD